MFPFWDSIIAPVIKASGAQRFVEIGALRGETTVKMLEDLGPNAEVHVIDPVPEFDPTEHEQRFGGRYVFHRDLSLNVLEGIGAVDVALVDGDHNWYTVYNELRLLRESSRREGKHLPVLVLHDVCWPYGRRDLYYAPDQIPEEFRQPYRQGGMRPEHVKLLERGGLNAQMDNAIEEGGPRNGVMTGLDDFIAEHDEPLRKMVLPIYWGLAIVVEERRLADSPELAALLDEIESDEGKESLLHLSETIRLEAAMFEQNVWRTKDRQISEGTRRYLAMVKGAAHDCAAPSVDDLLARLDTVRIGRVPGDLVAVGVDQGTALVHRGYLAAHHLWLRRLWVEAGDDPGRPAAPTAEALDRYGLLDNRVAVVQPGDLSPLGTDEINRIAVLHIGAAAGPTVAAVLDAAYDAVADGGIVVVDGADDPSVADAVEAFRARRSITAPTDRPHAGRVAWQRAAATT